MYIIIQLVFILGKLSSYWFCFVFTNADIYLATTLHISMNIFCSFLALNIPDFSTWHFCEALQFFGTRMCGGRAGAVCTPPLPSPCQQAHHALATVPWLLPLQFSIHSLLLCARPWIQYQGTTIRHSPLVVGGRGKN